MEMSSDVGRAVCVNIATMCNGVTNDMQLLFMVIEANRCIFMVYREHLDGSVYIYCLIPSYGGIVGYSYVIVLVLKCVMMRESRKGPLWG
jgi:hypothetical protein